MPAEHGSWAWLLVPFFVGTAVAGRFNLPVLLALLGGLAVFALRQPATVWLRGTVHGYRAALSGGAAAVGAGDAGLAVGAVFVDFWPVPDRRALRPFRVALPLDGIGRGGGAFHDGPCRRHRRHRNH
ncbi:MAG: YwiC-like family protein [Anaerolineae bacterium]